MVRDTPEAPRHPVRDIQVLTPMHRGPAGAGTLTTLLL